MPVDTVWFANALELLKTETPMARIDTGLA
jgi:hypothetical protein